MNTERERLYIYGELLNIYQELYRTKDSDRIRELYIEYLKLSIRLGNNSPDFREYNSLYGNCYTYALDVNCPAIFSQHKYLKPNFSFNVGFISELEKENVDEKSLIENFYQDCEALKIRCYESDFASLPKHGGYNIALFMDTFIEKNHDFHFVRQNYDGTLSHRKGFMGDIVLIDSMNKVDPDYRLVKTLEIVKPIIR